MIQWSVKRVCEYNIWVEKVLTKRGQNFTLIYEVSVCVSVSLQSAANERWHPHIRRPGANELGRTETVWEIPDQESAINHQKFVTTRAGVCLPS